MSLSPAGTADGPGWAVRLCWEGLETVMAAHNLRNSTSSRTRCCLPASVGPAPTEHKFSRTDEYTVFK